MRTAQVCPTCATYTNALCVIYNGEFLQNINVSPLDNLEDIIVNINNNLVPVHGAGYPSNSAVYEGQIYIDDATSQVYIAVATGGGSGDWEEVYTTANPPIPPIDGIDDVLSVGQSFSANRTMNIDTYTYTIASDSYPGGLLFIDDNNGQVFIGDVNGNTNNTVIYINDNNETIELSANTSVTVNSDNIVRSINGTLFADAAGDVTVPTIPYKSFVAKISQSGANPPTVDYLFENTLTNPVTYSYNSVGVYQINCADFDLPKTVAFFQQGSGSGGSNFQLPASTGAVTIIAYNNSGSLANGLFTYSDIEIRVYP
jgi:hypothetical protein